MVSILLALSPATASRSTTSYSFDILSRPSLRRRFFNGFEGGVSYSVILQNGTEGTG